MSHALTQLHTKVAFIGSCCEERLFFANKRLSSLSFNDFVDDERTKHLNKLVLQLDSVSLELKVYIRQVCLTLLLPTFLIP